MLIDSHVHLDDKRFDIDITHNLMDNPLLKDDLVAEK